MDRPRCVQCRNPIKERHVAVDDGDRHFHEDCWKSTHPDDVVMAPGIPVAAVPLVQPPVQPLVESLVEQRAPEPSGAQVVAQPSSEQRDYEQRIASGGLAALLSPYVSGLPVQRNSADSIPA